MEKNVPNNFPIGKPKLIVYVILLYYDIQFIFVVETFIT